MFNFLSENIFLTNAILAAVLASVACGVNGTFIVVKRISYVGGGIAHAVMGGLGIAYFFNFNPLIGAAAFAIVSAVLIGLVKLKIKQNEDIAISALWAVGMAVGIIFAQLTPGYSVDLLSFLFGNILMVTKESLRILLILDLAIVIFTFIFFRQIVYVIFDEEYAALRGIKVNLIYTSLLISIALSVVVLVQTVGIILAIALLTLPSASASMFSNNLMKIIFLSILFILVFAAVGLSFAFYANIPAGAAIILAAGLGYLLTFFLKQISKKVMAK